MHIMSSEEFNKLVEDIIQEIEEVIIKKRAEYSSNDNVLQNLVELQIMQQAASPSRAAYNLMVKQLNSLRQFSEGKDYTTELLEEKVKDVIIYVLLMYACLSKSGEVKMQLP